MIIVEKPVKSINAEIDALSGIPAGPNMSLIRQGAILALVWIKNGGKTPSESIADSSVMLKGNGS